MPEHDWIVGSLRLAGGGRGGRASGRQPAGCPCLLVFILFIAQPSIAKELAPNNERLYVIGPKLDSPRELQVIWMFTGMAGSLPSFRIRHPDPTRSGCASVEQPVLTARHGHGRVTIGPAYKEKGRHSYPGCLAMVAGWTPARRGYADSRRRRPCLVSARR